VGAIDIAFVATGSNPAERRDQAFHGEIAACPPKVLHVLGPSSEISMMTFVAASSIPLS
jgi:hypothetical protein